MRWIAAVVLLLVLATPATAQDQLATGTLTSTTCPGSGCVTLLIAGGGTGTIQLTGTWVATLQFEASTDGTAFIALPATPVSLVANSTTFTSAAGTWVIGAAGYRAVRVRASAYTSGTILATIRVSPGSQPAQTPLAGGRVSVDGSGVTQPVSAATLPLPTGAATSAIQGTMNSSLGSLDSKTPTISRSVSAASINLVIDGTGMGTVTGVSTNSPIDTYTLEATLDNGATYVPIPLVLTDSTPSTTYVPDGTFNSSAFFAPMSFRANISGFTLVRLRNTTVFGPVVWNMRVSPADAPVTSLPLPTGASTSANQATGNTSLSSIDTKTPVLVGGRVPVDGSAVTQPISATALPLPTDAATETTQSNVYAALTSGLQTFPVFGGGTTQSFTTAPNSFVTSFGAVYVSNRITVQASGTYTGAALNFTINGLGSTAQAIAGVRSDNGAYESTTGVLPANAYRSWIFYVPLVYRATFAVNLTAITSGSINIYVATDYSEIPPVSAATITNWPTTQPVSATALPLPTGASTSANQTTGNTSLASLDTKTPALGQALMAASTPVVLASNQSAVPVTGSGNFTVVQPTGTNLHIACDSGCGGAAPFSDNTAFTAGTSGVTNIGGVFNDGLAAVTSGNAAAPRITTNRGLHINLRNNAGTEIGTAAAPVRTDPTGTTTQPVSGAVTANVGTGNAVVSTVNSTTTPLGIGGVFTGTSEDVTEYADARITVFASQASATDGLAIQQSSDGTNWDLVDLYTVPAATGKTFGVGITARFFRVVYTNGGVAQATFRLATIFRKHTVKASSVRPQDARPNDNDMEETIAYLAGWNGATWDRLKVAVGALTTTNVESARTAGTLTSATCPGTGCVSVTTTNYAVASVTINGTYSLTPVFEFSDDGTNFYAVTCTRTDSAVQESTGGALVNTLRAWDCSVFGTTSFRVRASAFVSGTANIGIILSGTPIEAAPTVAAVGSTAKNAQPTTAVPTQDLKDSGRTLVTLTADNVVPVLTTDTLVTVVKLVGDTSTAGVTTYPVSAGKTLRLTSLSVTMVPSSTTAAEVRVRLRTLSSGTCLASSPLVGIWALSSPPGTLAANAGGVATTNVIFPEGIEFSGATRNICLSMNALGAAAQLVAISLIGYEY